MSASFFSFNSESPDTTSEFAERLSQVLKAGDVLLLEGPIGSGKTHFSRALIKARLNAASAPDEDVPSPTFTLIQTYEAGPVEIWHADLYRLSHPDEAEELGLFQAFETAIVLVEWPDRLGDLAPKHALLLQFDQGRKEDERTIAISGNAKWRDRLQSLRGVAKHV